MKIKQWIEAMRLRTLPVSVAGVFMGTACAVLRDSFRPLPAVLCLLFAVLAQIASNFANEYYDFKNGLDRKGRAGFRRGVTEGDISPRAMRYATYGTLALAGIVGIVTVILWGSWWMFPVGIAIALFALAYSTGPYPLSHHGLGDIAVIIFFGFVPVTLTTYLQTGDDFWNTPTLLASFAIGLMAANVLIVNNYRDMEDDDAVGKHTTCVIFGRKVMGWAYLVFGIAAMFMMIPMMQMIHLSQFVTELPLIIYTVFLFSIRNALIHKHGAALNPLLGRTAINLLIFSLFVLVLSFIS